jgi:antitoxin VapB
MQKIAKIFMNGRSQAVRLPKEFRFESDEVFVQRQGNRVILSTAEPGWDDFFELTPVFDDDFLSEREDLPPQGRNDF